jgi:hypothetical protein
LEEQGEDERNGGISMMENMIGDLARTMQDDRRTRAAHNERIAEAIEGERPDALGGRARKRRAAIAKALMALAMRLAPPMGEGAPLSTISTQ